MKQGDSLFLFFFHLNSHCIAQDCLSTPQDLGFQIGCANEIHKSRI